MWLKAIAENMQWRFLQKEKVAFVFLSLNTLLFPCIHYLKFWMTWILRLSVSVGQLKTLKLGVGTGDADLIGVEAGHHEER